MPQESRIVKLPPIRRRKTRIMPTMAASSDRKTSKGAVRIRQMGIFGLSSR